MNLPSVTIIILNWNGRAFLHDCLTALMALDYPNFQTTLVDNGSTDDSVSFVRAHFPQVTIIENGANVGFAAGNNVALRNWHGEIAVLLNPDVVVAADWLRNLVQPFLRDERVGICGGKLLYPDGRTLQHIGGRLLYPQAMPIHEGFREADNGQHNQERDVEYVIGAAMACKRALIEQIGLLDEGFFLYFEDTDFCYRARQAGFRVVYTPQATAVHIESASTSQNSVAYLRQFHASRWRFLLKHYSFEHLVHDTIPAEQYWISRIPIIEQTAVIYAYQMVRQMLPNIANIPRGAAFSSTQANLLSQALQRLELTARHIRAALDPETGPTDPLREMALVQERPFTSNLPLIGPLVAGFRQLWNSVSTQWYVRPLLAQQNQFNQILVTRLQELEARLISQDQELSALAQDHAELTTQVIQLTRRLQEREEGE